MRSFSLWDLTCWYETGEYQTLSGGDVLSDGDVDSGIARLEGSQSSSLRQTEHGVANTECVEESPQDGKGQDWQEVIEESIVVQSDGWVQNDRRKQVVEEELCC